METQDQATISDVTTKYPLMSTPNIEHTSPTIAHPKTGNISNAIIKQEPINVISVIKNQSQQVLITTDKDQTASIFPTPLVIQFEQNNNQNKNESEKSRSENMSEMKEQQQQSMNKNNNISKNKTPTAVISPKNTNELILSSNINNIQQPPPSTIAAINQQPLSRWTLENRMILKKLMCSLPSSDIGAALRVVLDTFGVKASKLLRRGEIIELDLVDVTDDFVLDSLWSYCTTVQYNILANYQPIINASNNVLPCTPMTMNANHAMNNYQPQMQIQQLQFQEQQNQMQYEMQFQQQQQMIGHLQNNQYFSMQPQPQQQFIAATNINGQTQFIMASPTMEQSQVQQYIQMASQLQQQMPQQ